MTTPFTLCLTSACARCSRNITACLRGSFSRLAYQLKNSRTQELKNSRIQEFKNSRIRIGQRPLRSAFRRCRFGKGNVWISYVLLRSGISSAFPASPALARGKRDHHRSQDQSRCPFNLLSHLQQFAHEFEM